MSLPMQKARYRAQALAVAFGLSSNNNTQIAITFEIVENDEFAGESIAWIGHFTDKTANRTIESLQHCGWQGDELIELADLDDADVREMLPDVVELVCEPEEYEGEWRLRVQWVNKPGGGRFTFKERLEGDSLRAFSAQMRATVRSVRGGGPRRQSQPAPPAQPVQPAQRELPSGSSWSSGGRTTSQRHPNAPGERDDIPF